MRRALTLGNGDAAQQAAIVTPEASDTTAAKVDNKRPARSRKPKTEAKPVDLAAAGLQLVETKADAPKVTAPVEAEKPRAPRKAASWQKNAKDEASCRTYGDGGNTKQITFVVEVDIK